MKKPLLVARKSRGPKKQVRATCFARSAAFRPGATRGGRVDDRGVTSAPAVSVRPIWLGDDRAPLATRGRTRT